MPLYTPSTGGIDMATEYTNTQPASPSKGLTLFTRDKARRLPAFVGPSGQDSSLQPGMFANRITRVNAINNTGTPTTDGIAITATQTASGVQNATTNFYTAMVRNRYSTTTTASTGGGLRSTTAQWFLSSTTGLGGFFFVCRFGIQAVSAATQTRWFVGMSTTAGGALSATTDPTALLSLVGFGANAADTNMRFIQNDATGTATSVDLGANFPAKTTSTYFYEVRMFAAAAAGLNLTWSATRLNDSLYAEGTATTDLPALNALLAAHINIGNGTTAALSTIDFQSLYIETDN